MAQDNREFIRESVDHTLNITPSVLALARIAKIAPDMFAKALADKDANADYTIALAGEVLKADRASQKASKKVEDKG